MTGLRMQAAQFLEGVVDIIKPPSTIEIGEFVEGQGIYVGCYPVYGCDDENVKDAQGNVVYRYYFSATNDLCDESTGKSLCLSFREASEHIAKMEPLHGRAGNLDEMNNVNHDYAVSSFEEGVMNDRWHKPNSEIMGDILGYSLLDRGDFKGENLTIDPYGFEGPVGQYGTVTQFDLKDDRTHYAGLSPTQLGFSGHLCGKFNAGEDKAFWRPVRSVSEAEFLYLLKTKDGENVPELDDYSYRYA